MLQAHNGSGKTTCFTLAMLSRVDENIQQTQALCICPTRELVIQNLEVLQKMSRHTQIQATSTSRTEIEGRRSAPFHLLNGSTFSMDPPQHRNYSSECHEELQLIAEIRKFRSRLSLALMASLGTGLASACWTHRELRYWCSMKQIKCSRYLELPQDCLYCYLVSGAP